MYGLTDERYYQLHDNGVADYTIEGLIRYYGRDAVQKGYIQCRQDNYQEGSSVVPGALHIEHISQLAAFNSDWDACRQAEKDGVKFINDMDGLEKGYYIDTTKNRKICADALVNHPDLRIENWLDVEDGEWGTRYAEHFLVQKDTRPQEKPRYAREWVKNLDEIDKDCVHRYEYLLGRKLWDHAEYSEIDGLVDEMILEWTSRKTFFKAYPELRKYTNRQDWEIREFAKSLIDHLSAEGCGPECGYDRYGGANYNALLTFDIEEHIRGKRYSVYEVDARTNETTAVHSCPASLTSLSRLIKSIVDQEFESMREAYIGKKVVSYMKGRDEGSQGKRIGIITDVDAAGVHIYDSRGKDQQHFVIPLKDFCDGEKNQRYHSYKPRVRRASVEEQIHAAAARTTPKHSMSSIKKKQLEH